MMETNLVLEAQVHELGESLTKVRHELSLILVVHLSILLESWIFGKHKVAGQHHQVTRRILILEWACPWPSFMGLLHRPLFFEKQAKVLIGNGSWRPGPWTPETRRGFVASPKSMRATEGNNL